MVVLANEHVFSREKTNKPDWNTAQDVEQSAIFSITTERGVQIVSGTDGLGPDRWQQPLELSLMSIGHHSDRSATTAVCISRPALRVVIPCQTLADVAEAISMHRDTATAFRNRPVTDPNLEDAIDLLLAELFHPATGRLQKDGLVQQVCERLLELQFPNRTSSSISSRPAWIARVFSYVREHLDMQITISDLAKCAELSKFHFCRRFKETIGVPPARFIIHERLRLARRLLLEDEPHLSLSQIAIRAGFSDQPHLTRRFKSYFGQPPGAFRIAAN